MILFQKDWFKYPRAIPDYETKNRSYVELAQKYKAVGVKNHKFLLALHNPDLQGIDPHSLDLTAKQKEAIIIECTENYWFWLREVAKAPAEGLFGGVPFTANRGNIATAWFFFNRIMVFLMQIRQTGKSVGMDLVQAYIMNIYAVNTNVTLITKDEPLRIKNIARLKEIMSFQPSYLNQRTKKDSDNKESIEISSLGNKLTCLVAQASAKAADRLGRGFTAPFMFWDEIAYLLNLHISVSAALPGVSAARDVAIRENLGHGVMMATTAGDLSDPAGEYAHKLFSSAADMNEAMYDCPDQETLAEVIMKASKRIDPNIRVTVPMINITLNHTQLGKNDEWLDKTIGSTLSTDPEAINKDYFNRWSAGGKFTAIDKLLAEVVKKSVMEPLHTKIDDKYFYMTKWYIPENTIDEALNTTTHVLAFDTSEASGGDDISLILVNAETGEVAAAGKYNETNFIRFSEWVAEWFFKYSKLVCVIEKRSTGAALLDNLFLRLPEKGIDPFKVLFNWVVNDSDENQDYAEVLRMSTYRKQTQLVILKKLFGFATSGGGRTSRSDLYGNTLQAAVKLLGGFIYDKDIAEQLLTLERIDGRVNHRKGSHDDMVIGWLLCYWFLTKTKNLSHYGIDPRRILSRVRKTEVFKTERDKVNDYRQNSIRSKIQELSARLEAEENDIISDRIEYQLRMLNKSVAHDDNETFALDDLIARIKEGKKQKRQNGNTGHHVQVNRMNKDYGKYGLGYHNLR